ncbi:hypothetical protein ACOALZ_11805 [Nocardiopsis algeriensis]|uniref:hypothetical protein n=1 Tax=Nocardiopsis algeriensis TaxID=1478215 RepID=UPI003B42DA6E
MSDLINPRNFPVPQTLTYSLDSQAGTFKDNGADLADKGNDIKSAWGGLQGIYSAPEAETLFSVLDPVATDGEDVSDNITKASTALIEFAETVKGIQDRWRTLRTDTNSFLASIDNGNKEGWDEGSGFWFWKEESENVTKHNELLDRAAALKHEFEEAERKCANAITGLFGGTRFVPQNSEGSRKNGDKTFVYGLEEPLTGVPMEWGAPQSTDHAWYNDLGDAVGDFTVGIAEDLGGMVGIHGENGWFSDSWGDNLWNYWGGAVEGAASLVGVGKDENGNWGFSWETMGSAWKEAAHSVVPWEEWGERPWYTIGTAVLNIGSMAAGAALTATGVGAVVGVPLLAWRGSRILGAVGDGGRGPDADMGPDGGADIGLPSRVPGFGDGSIPPVDLGDLTRLNLNMGDFGRMTDALERLNNSTGGGSSPDLGESGRRNAPGGDGSTANNKGGGSGDTNTGTSGGDSSSRPTVRDDDKPEDTRDRRPAEDRESGRDRDEADAGETTHPTTELLDSSQDFLDGVDPESVRGLDEGLRNQERDWVANQVPDDASSVNDTPVQRYESEAEVERPEELVRVGGGEYEIAEGADNNRVDMRSDNNATNSAGGDGGNSSADNSHRGDTNPIDADAGRGGSGTGDSSHPSHGSENGSGSGVPGEPIGGNGRGSGHDDSNLPNSIDELQNYSWGDTPEGRNRFYEHFENLVNDRGNGVFEEFYQKNGYRQSRHTTVGPDEFQLPKLSWFEEDNRWIVQETLKPADPPNYVGDVSKADALVPRDPNNPGYGYLDALAETRRSAITADGEARTRLDALEEKREEHVKAGEEVPEELVEDIGKAREEYARTHTEMGRASEDFGEASAEIAIQEQFDGSPVRDDQGNPVLDDNGNPVHRPKVTEQIAIPDTAPKSGNHQFDQIWRTETGEIIVVEAKSSTSTALGDRLVKGDNGSPLRVSQGTRAYLESVLESMRKRGEKDSRNPFTEEDLADEIQEALDQKNLRYVEVKGNPVTNYDDSGDILDSRSEGYSFREFDLRTR